MERDARMVRDQSRLEADVCIVGAGPAGISIARELIGREADVLLLESGGLDFDEGLQELNDGPTIGDPYTGLRQSRHRQAGGAANLWNTRFGNEVGAKFVPLDPWDFENRMGLQSGWPFERSHLERFYQRAQTVCGLGKFAYDGVDWPDPELPTFTLDDDRLATRVYQFGPGRLFTHQYVGDLVAARNVTLCHHATVCRIEAASQCGGKGRRIPHAAVASAAGGPGGRFTVGARIFVLAAGAVENARLLLLSGGGVSGADALGNAGAWVGRCFMEHPRDRSLTLIPRSRELFRAAAFYDAHPALGGWTIGGRLALTANAMRDAGLPNASVTLLPRLRGQPPGAGPESGWVARLRRLVARPTNTGYGWSRNLDPPAVFDAFHLLLNVEQRPHPENRITLAAGHDALDLPCAQLHWRWRPEEQDGLERLRKLIASALEGAGLGRVEMTPDVGPDPNAHHHAGTTRMSADPGQGVVDLDGRVHGTDNLYVAGASVFPTAGFANPVLTIVAMALRLADHLKQRL